MINDRPIADEAPIEFDCCDCGRHVLVFGFHIQVERCNSCYWISENVAPEHQTDARDRLGVPLVQRH
jgi:hypothetical protein